MNVRIKILLLSIFICILSSCVQTNTSENFENKKMLWQGIDREYLIFLPTSYFYPLKLPISLHAMNSAKTQE